jgi:hypothetical protein
MDYLQVSKMTILGMHCKAFAIVVSTTVKVCQFQVNRMFCVTFANSMEKVWTTLKHSHLSTTHVLTRLLDTYCKM